MNWTKSLINDHKVILRTLEVLRRMANRYEKREEVDFRDVESVLHILRVFADDYHQGKEESVLFPALMESGMATQESPLRPLLFEHEQDRSLMVGIEDAMRTGKGKDFVHYVSRLSGILSTHIYKEENFLFAMADTLLTDDQKMRIEAHFNHLETNLNPEIVNCLDRLKDLECRYLGKAA